MSEYGRHLREVSDNVTYTWPMNEQRAKKKWTRDKLIRRAQEADAVAEANRQAARRMESGEEYTTGQAVKLGAR